MSQQESENYNTIRTKPTYRSPIIRNRTIYKHDPSNIRQENIQDKQIQNKIDKTFNTWLTSPTFSFVNSQ